MNLAYADPPYLGCCRLYDHFHNDGGPMPWDGATSEGTTMNEIDYTTYWHEQCGRQEPHGRHQLSIAHCDHEHDVWCWGVPEPGSMAAQVESLKPGQRVRIVFEGVVSEPQTYESSHPDSARRPAVVVDCGEDDRLVLRYTGTHPSSTGIHRRYGVDGKLHAGIATIEVLPA